MTADNLQSFAKVELPAASADSVDEAGFVSGPGFECLAFMVALLGVAGVTSLAFIGIL